jgi:MerR family transcriptional regulator/heat shock protein HspR
VKRVLALEAELAATRAELERVRDEARRAVIETERAHRRDLVPLSQAVVLYGQRPSLFDR